MVEAIDYIDYGDSIPFLLPIVHLFILDSPQMMRISIDAPSLLELKAGNELSKSFRINDTRFRRGEDSPGLPPLLRQVKQFVVSGFT